MTAPNYGPGYVPGQPQTNGYPPPPQYQAPPQYAPPPQYQPPPQYGGYAPQGFAPQGYAPPLPQAPPPAAGSLDAFYEQPSVGGGPSLSFDEKKGMPQWYVVCVRRELQDSDVVQQINLQNKLPAFYNDGRPKFVMKVPVNCAVTQQYPQGEAQWYVQGAARDELARAMTAAGSTDRVPRAGAVVLVHKTGTRPSGPGMNPASVFAITYYPPGDPNGVGLAQQCGVALVQGGAPAQAPVAPTEQPAPPQAAPQPPAPPAAPPQVPQYAPPVQPSNGYPVAPPAPPQTSWPVPQPPAPVSVAPAPPVPQPPAPPAAPPTPPPAGAVPTDPDKAALLAQLIGQAG